MSQKKPADSGEKRPRLEREHLFRFNCYPGVSCFTQCCQDITIVLTPFDVLRLKNRLGISSDEFLEKYTIIIQEKDQLIPLVILKMNENDKKCPFITPEGCTVYDDRPWPCRMYPLDTNEDGTFSLIVDASHCLGLRESDSWKISDWLSKQGVGPYEEMNELLSKITVPLNARGLDITNPEITKMTFMSLYNLDKFRDFVFKSTFLDRFEIEPERIKKIKDSDESLLLFAFDWIKFGLFGKKVFGVKQKPSETTPSN